MLRHRVAGPIANTYAVPGTQRRMAGPGTSGRERRGAPAGYPAGVETNRSGGSSSWPTHDLPTEQDPVFARPVIGRLLTVDPRTSPSVARPPGPCPANSLPSPPDPNTPAASEDNPALPFRGMHHGLILSAPWSRPRPGSAPLPLPLATRRDSQRRTAVRRRGTGSRPERLYPCFFAGSRISDPDSPAGRPRTERTSFRSRSARIRSAPPIHAGRGRDSRRGR